jgi:hypothetical protein
MEMTWMMEVYLECKWRRQMKNPSDTALKVRIEGVCIRKIRNDDPLEIIGMGCNTSVGLELFRLFGFPDNSTYFESSFES